MVDLEDKKKVVKMSTSVANMILKEAIQVSKFADGYLEIIEKSEKTWRRVTPVC